jgi:hypothetical protein
MAERKKNKGGNSQLEDRYWNCPDYVLNCLDGAVKRYETLKMKNGKTEGYERAKGILEHKRIGYGQMKRIKNWFDLFDGDWEDEEFKLNGGSTMKNWVNNQLDTATAVIKNIKDAQKDTNPNNTFIKSHEKDNSKIPKPKSILSIPNLGKDIGGQISRGKPIYEPMGMNEEIQRIKNLIIYKSKI